MRKFKFLLICLFLLGIGFASVSTTLQIDGNVNIAKNIEDYDIRFTKAALDGVNITTTAISSDGKTLTYTPNNLSAVGNKSTVNFEITNNSIMYDADVNVVCTASGNNDYYQIVPSIKSPIKGKSSEFGKVEVSLLQALGSGVKNTFTCTLGTKAKERTTKAETVSKYMPMYFAYGNPTTASTQDYTTLRYPASDGGGQAKVFIGLDADGIQKSLCIIRNGNLECFKNKKFEEEKDHYLNTFWDTDCNDNGSRIRCKSSDFDCSMNYHGVINCSDKDLNTCVLESDDSVSCELW